MVQQWEGFLSETFPIMIINNTSTTKNAALDLASV